MAGYYWNYSSRKYYSAIYTKQFSDTGPSNDALTLKLCTSTAPPLNLIDLPGLRSAHPSYSLSQYAKSNNAMLLVVIPASQALNVDSAKAIQVAKALDPSCSRIVGVISKIDRAASEPRVLAAVENINDTINKTILVVKFAKDATELV